MLAQFIFIVFIFGVVVASPVSKSAHKTHNRIFGGKFTEPNKYPFLVTTTILEEDYSYHTGGAVLISNNYVLTAAQFIYRYDSRSIILGVGAHDFANPLESFVYRTEDLLEVLHVHEHFDLDTLENNIALILLRGGVEFGDKIQSIALPPASFTSKHLTDVVATVAGWGIDEESDFNTEYPKEVNVTIIPPAVCRHFFASFYGPFLLCSDGEYKVGGCKGDEGTALFTVGEDGSMVLIGLVSVYSSLGCDSRWPTGYVNVAGYLDWINENMKIS